MSHVKIMKKAAKKLDKDASHYHTDATKTKSKIKKKHDRIEEREARGAAKDLRKRASKSHEY